MADVRSLLRNELASRKGTSQPNTTGNRVTKKRKVDSGDGVVRKKLRGTDLDTLQASSNEPIINQSSPQDEGVEVAGADFPEEDDQEAVEPTAEPSQGASLVPDPPQQAPVTVDEDEWASFEREVAAPSRLSHAPAAVAAEATISAAPVSAEEIAAQQETEKASTARAREAELEGEREDAARFMEDEFDEMDQLEERVRRLKQKREELRNKRAEERSQTLVASGGPGVGEQQAAAESDSDEDEDEEWDDWRFK
ncbi:hypothetical protein NUU61_003087 [Penicillium alfredii]|uniref:Uncharacterized protein n=1 Tax=Penicillium alfredii TaxID=1506179 RepID=A0A9W9FTF4_9EURO|nr:uncharacterized protein NUU61_003087 [Penicillium alfredii]KAJ5105740.1 hypothetical protein NUU61_003087 [Penicillium alfredii]